MYVYVDTCVLYRPHVHAHIYTRIRVHEQHKLHALRVAENVVRHSGGGRAQVRRGLPERGQLRQSRAHLAANLRAHARVFTPFSVSMLLEAGHLACSQLHRCASLHLVEIERETDRLNRQVARWWRGFCCTSAASRFTCVSMLQRRHHTCAQINDSLVDVCLLLRGGLGCAS